MTANTADARRHEHEAEFHDRWAGQTDLDAIRVREAFEAPTALENRFILRHMGDLRTRRLLDVGCGLGESSVYFALRGARVTATDLSPGMVEKTLALAARHGVHVEGVVSAGESLNAEPASYDFVYAANTVHHVHDRDALYAQVARALRPGGRFYAWDPIAYNPVINIYRRMASGVRTPDESPLTFAEPQRLARHLANVGHREFWIASLALFVKYYLVDRVHPNADRYWKRILGETDRSLRWWKPLAACDAALTRLPLVKRLAWNMVMWGEKPEAQAATTPGQPPPAGVAPAPTPSGRPS